MTPLELLDDHTRRPRNIGKLLNATAIGDVGSIVAGDALRFYIGVVDGRISAARFQVFNSADQVGAASVVTEIAVGKTLEEANRLSSIDVRQALGALEVEHLPPQVWALEGLRSAIAVVQGVVLEYDTEGEPIICRCHGITETTIRQAITVGGAKTLDEVVAATRAGSGCGTCRPDISKLITDVLAQADAPASVEDVAVKPQPMGRIQTLLRIQRAFEKRLAPSLREQKIELELWDFDGRLVHVRLKESTTTDPAKRQALSDLEQLIKAEIDPSLGVSWDA